jgi:hypothetical protein
VLAEFLGGPNTLAVRKCRVFDLESGFLAAGSHAFNRAIF